MKVTVSTSIEEEDLKRVERLVAVDGSHDALILRKAIVRGLPKLERDILGPEFVGGARRKRKEVPA
jgi:flagellar biosynthesis regulator FlbT